MAVGAIPRDANAARLRITLEHIEPAPFRVMDVPLNFTLAKLHELIQWLFGWEDCHLWSFEVGGARVELSDPDALRYPGGVRTLDARRFTLLRAIREGDGRMRYTYDFGDDWVHRIDSVKVFRVEKPLDLPAFIEGAWAGPPEDVGGPFGFMDFKEAMEDPSHEEHDHFREWYGRPFDDADIGEERIRSGLAYLRRRNRSRRRKAKRRP